MFTVLAWLHMTGTTAPLPAEVLRTGAGSYCRRIGFALRQSDTQNFPADAPWFAQAAMAQMQARRCSTEQRGSTPWQFDPS